MERFCQGIFVRPEIAAGRLIHLFPDWLPSVVEVSLVFRSRRELSPIVRAFVDYMKEVSRPGFLWMDAPLSSETSGSGNRKAVVGAQL